MIYGDDVYFVKISIQSFLIDQLFVEFVSRLSSIAFSRRASHIIAAVIVAPKLQLTSHAYLSSALVIQKHQYD